MDKIKVQIVEDDSVSAKVIERDLINSGYIISSIVNSGEEAIKSADRNRPDVILMDIKLNDEMDGIEAAMEIKSLLNIPVIFISSHSDEKTLERAMITEPFGFIVKPFQKRELAVNISMAIYKNKIERKLKENERRLEQAGQVAQLGYCELDLVKNELFWSDEIYRIFEIDPREIKVSYKTFLNAIHSDDRVFVDKTYSESVKNKTSFNIEYRLLMKDGRVKYVNEKCNTEYDDNENPIRSLAIIQDITERKLKEYWLRLTLFSVDKTADAVFWLNPDGKFVYVNEQACRSLGYSNDELLKMTALDISPNLTAEEWPNHWEELKRLGSFTFETKHKRKDGSEFPVEISVNYIEYEEKEYNCAFARNITERKRAEESLKTKTYQQAILSELGKKALAGLDIQLLMNDIVNVIANTLKVEYCKVLELLPDEKSFLLCAGIGWKDGLVGHANVDAGSGSQSGYTLQYNRPVIVKDLQKETRFSGPPLLVDHGVVSGISVIISGATRPFGVLGAHTTKRQSFTEEDIYFLQSVSNLLANAIQRKKIEVEREELVQKLQKALGEIKTLEELVHVCASCKKIRDDEGHWKPVDEYLIHHTDSKPNHAICPDCSKSLYPDIYDKDRENGK